jgi:hypothetical protein
MAEEVSERSDTGGSGRYWKEKLEGYEILNLITDRERPAYVRYEGEDASFEFDGETSERIKETAKELGVSVYTVLLRLSEKYTKH